MSYGYRPNPARHDLSRAKPGIMPGVYEDLPADEYHADPSATPSLSASIARILCTESPLHAWAKHPRLNPDYVKEEDEKFDIGNIAHELLLEQWDRVEVIDAKDWRTNAAKEARDAARAAGKIPLLTGRWQEVQEMVKHAVANLTKIDISPPLLMGGKPEQTLVWQEDGVICRARLDYLRDDYRAIDDLKTTSRSANPESWSRSLFSMGYDIQAAFYLRGLEAVTGAKAEWRWVVLETTAPYAASVLSLGPAGLELAQAKVEYAIGKWRECIQRDEWPGYAQQIHYADLPGWEEARWLEKEGREEAAA